MNWFTFLPLAIMLTLSAALAKAPSRLHPSWSARLLATTGAMTAVAALGTGFFVAVNYAATLAPSAAAIGARLHVDERLRELDFGHGEGLTRAEMERKFPAELRAFLADPAASHLPGGEDPAAAARRFTACLDDIARLHEGGRVLVVAHSTAIRLALCRLLGIPLKDYRRRFPSLGNCALTEIRLRDGDAALLEFNTPLER
ncbi:hypothetical protein GCM10023178_17440 [Actinomadura luteofluorescens]